MIPDCMWEKMYQASCSSFPSGIISSFPLSKVALIRWISKVKVLLFKCFQYQTFTWNFNLAHACLSSPIFTWFLQYYFPSIILFCLYLPWHLFCLSSKHWHFFTCHHHLLLYTMLHLYSTIHSYYNINITTSSFLQTFGLILQTFF